MCIFYQLRKTMHTLTGYFNIKVYVMRGARYWSSLGGLSLQVFWKNEEPLFFKIDHQKDAADREHNPRPLLRGREVCKENHPNDDCSY